MKPRSLHMSWQLIDYAMSPFMRLMSMALFERPQESHAWHAQKFNDDEIASIDLKKCVVIEGDDASSIKSGAGPLFHIPLIGGWRNYVVLEVEPDIDTWHVGWIVRDTNTMDILRAELHKLPLYERRVRMLVGPEGRKTTFCAFNPQGQVRLTNIGKGRIGDGSSYAKIRLF
ncbi:MAG: hypothetical protein G01um10148_1032 [Parcubacteria group bacterium Gr01-1014_8]|nr:MAG: hypothetical protein G01um10148_1032 [Parcubacteria group bacterium Gr01-1014_8]